MTFFSLRSPASRSTRVFVLLVTLGVACEAPLAHAGEPGLNGDRSRGEQVTQRQEARGVQREQQNEARQNAERQQTQQRDERVRGAAGAAPQDGRDSRPGRLSPDERRALRQQINEAGRNVYRAPPP